MKNFVEVLTQTFSSCVWLAILLVAVCPLLESKIAIPLALNSAIWAGRTVSPISAFLISFLGSSIPCFIVIFLTRKLKYKTTGFIANKVTNKYKTKASKLDNYSPFQKCLALCGFSALPLPLTGVWSSSVIAGFANLKIRDSIIAILIGNLISCGIMFALCKLAGNSVGNILLISISIVILFLLFDLVMNLFSNKKRKSNFK